MSTRLRGSRERMANCRQLKRMLKRINLLIMCPVVVVVWVIAKHVTPEHRPLPHVAPMDQKFVYVHRRNKLLEMCESKEDSFNKGNVISYASDSHKRLLLCSVPNIAESFQSDLVNAEPKAKSESNISRNASNAGDVYRQKPKPKLFQDTTGNVRSSHQDYTSVILTSDPYWRLYSVYLEEIVIPGEKNLIWQSRFNETFQYWARDITSCQYGLSFTTFIRYVIRTKARDSNLRPLAELCSVCHMKYDIIAKLETIEDDVLRFSEHFDLKPTSISSKLSKDRVRTDITDLVNQSFSWFYKNANKLCLTKLDIAQRIWKALKLRGVIRNSQHFPSELLEKDFKADDLISIVQRECLTISLYYSAYQIFLSTFRTVPFSDRKAISELYSLDFLAFDYDFYPRQLFEYLGEARSGEIPSKFLGQKQF